jgi:hypothetical protein
MTRYDGGASPADHYAARQVAQQARQRRLVGNELYSERRHALFNARESNRVEIRESTRRSGQ